MGLVGGWQRRVVWHFRCDCRSRGPCCRWNHAVIPVRNVYTLHCAPMHLCVATPSLACASDSPLTALNAPRNLKAPVVGSKAGRGRVWGCGWPVDAGVDCCFWWPPCHKPQLITTAARYRHAVQWARPPRTSSALRLTSFLEHLALEKQAAAGQPVDRRAGEHLVQCACGAHAVRVGMQAFSRPRRLSRPPLFEPFGRILTGTPGAPLSTHRRHMCVSFDPLSRGLDVCKVGRVSGLGDLQRCCCRRCCCAAGAPGRARVPCLVCRRPLQR
jgi:hypothetical protein